MSALTERLLRSCVPIRALTKEHLGFLMRDRSVEAFHKGKVLFSIGDTDDSYIYLLQGEVQIQDNTGKQTHLADDGLLMWPLVHHQPRQHTATALTDGSIIRFSIADVDGMLAWDQAATYIKLGLYENLAEDEEAQDTTDWMLLLLNSNLFYRVPPIRLPQIIHSFEKEFVATGDTIVRQGEIGEACYFIEKGIAQVTRSESGQGKSKQLATLQKGAVFGEDALLGNTVRNATVKMLTDGVLRKLGKQSFLQLIKEDTETKKITLAEAKIVQQNGGQLIDVRTEDEYDAWHYDNALHMPLNLLKLKSTLLRKTDPIVTYCDTGKRSKAAAALLKQEGFNTVYLVMT